MFQEEEKLNEVMYTEESNHETIDDHLLGQPSFLRSLMYTSIHNLLKIPRGILYIIIKMKKLAGL